MYLYEETTTSNEIDRKDIGTIVQVRFDKTRNPHKVKIHYAEDSKVYLEFTNLIEGVTC